MTVTAPRVSLSDLVAQHGLITAPPGVAPVSDWTATLQQIAANNGGVLPVPTFTKTIQLFDDGNHNDGAMEPDGVFAATIDGITGQEGTYQFHAIARYGRDCPATREAFWSLTVGLEDDPYRHIAKDRPG